MSFIAIDRNVESSWYSRVAGWGFDLICARENESDYDFVLRAIENDCIAILSKDTDIPNLIDFKFRSRMIWSNNPKALYKLIFKGRYSYDS
jgi:hypothetical protein